MQSHQLKAIALAACSFALAPLCLVATDATPDDDRTLKSLYDTHRWFELRDFVANRTTPLFYQGAVACAFNDLQRCNEKLKFVINSDPQSDKAVEAHRLLASAYFRQGKYREALTNVDAVLALRPEDSDAGDERPFLAALGGFPDLAVTRRRLTTLQLQEAGLPFSISGVTATYWFDTGADISVLTESEAKRFGLHVLAATIKEGDVTGTKLDSQIAIADELSIGSIRLRNVAFLVVSDEQPPFNQLPPGSRGLIGMPVLFALQRFVWGADRKFEIGSKSLDQHGPHADLCFDGHHPIAQIQFENRSLAFTLDTGATNTDLYPPFAAMFPELMRNAPKSESYKMEGVGGSKNMDAAILSSLHFSIGNFPVVLSSAAVLLAHTTESSKFFDGNLGIDLLQQSHQTTFDFKAMTLTLR